MWMILVIVGAWVAIVAVGVVAALVMVHLDQRRGLPVEQGEDAKVIEFPSGHAGTEPRPHVEVSFRDALDAAAREPSHRLRSELRRPGGLQD